ncbi:unnamed protein product, partial [Prorocentrum cordatum]
VSGSVDRDIIGVMQRQCDRCGPDQLTSPPPTTCHCDAGSAWVGAAAGFAVGVMSDHPPAPSWLRSLIPGARLYVRYPDEDLWHERLLCGRARADGWSWVALTPTGDQREEDFVDAAEILACGPKGGIPVKLHGKHLFKMEHRSNTHYADFMAAGLKLADELVSAGGGGPAPPPEAGPWAPLADADVERDPATKWITLESRFGYAAGDPIDVVGQPFLRSGDRGVLELAEGPIAVGISDTAVTGLTPRAGPLDSRLLGASSDATSMRQSFAQRAQLLETGDNQKWMVQGPPTMRWVCLAHVEGNATPKQRHFWWRQVLGLVSTDPGVEEHSFLCELIETAVARGGLNVAALEAFETVSRRFQLWEEFYAEALRIAEASDHGDDLGERRLFLGSHRSKGLAIASPELEQHVATKLQEESAVLKERRKGREERRLARTDPTRPSTSSGSGAAASGAQQPPRQTQPPVRNCVERLLDLSNLVRVGPDSCAHKRGGCVRASRALQGSRCGYADSLTDGKVAAYRRGEVSLPQGKTGGVSLLNCPGPELQAVLVSGQGLLRSDRDRDNVLLDAPRVPAMDVNLGKGGADYGRFLGELYDLGAIEVRESPQEVCGLFFAPRKDWRLRLIWDTRRPNAHFEVPPFTASPSGEALAALEIDESIAGQRIVAPSADVEVCFYQCELPSNLRPFFALKSVDLRFLPRHVRGQVSQQATNGHIQFQSRVAPMGWAWAVHLVQQAHMSSLKDARPLDSWVLDKVPTEPISASHLAKILYIDNFASIGPTRARPDAATADMITSLADAGVKSDMGPSSGTFGAHDLLGFSLVERRATWALSARKFWKIKGALDYVVSSSQGFAGAEMERLLGHLVSCFLLRREMLLLLYASYTFAQETKLRRVPLWPSVRKELRWCRALLPLVAADMSRPWSPLITSYDASPWGYGVCETSVSASQSGQIGRLNDRSRWKGLLATNRRPRDDLADLNDVDGDFKIPRGRDTILSAGAASGFTEVGPGFLRDAAWVT